MMHHIYHLSYDGWLYMNNNRAYLRATVYRPFHAMDRARTGTVDNPVPIGCWHVNYHCFSYFRFYTTTFGCRLYRMPLTIVLI